MTWNYWQLNLEISKQAIDHKTSALQYDHVKAFQDKKKYIQRK